MLTNKSPISGTPIHHPKSIRQPLQQINSSSNFSTPPINAAANKIKSNLKLGWNGIFVADDSNKENYTMSPLNADLARIESFGSSLAEELSAIREKMERLKVDKENTEKMLRERDLKMEMQMNELDKRGEMQRILEIEVDRLYRLKELRSLCMRVTPIRSLREKEEEKIKPQEMQGDKKDEIKENAMHSTTRETDGEK